MKYLTGVVVAFAALCFSAVPPDSVAAGVYTGPLFDAHCHFVKPPEGRGRRGGGAPGGQSGISPVTLFDLLEKTGVTGVYLFAPADQALSLQKTRNSFVHAFANVPIDVQHQELRLDARTPASIEDQLKQGMQGVGEIPMRHRPTFHGDYKGYPADGPIALAVYEVAGRYKVPVNLHVEHEYKGELEHALAMRPNTTFIWAHAGDGPASTVGTLMKKYPNLYADISTRNPYMKVGRPASQQQLTNRDGSIQKEWKSVFEEFPDRFLYGLDLTTTERVDLLQQVTAYYRAVLGQLTPATAEKIAFKNAKRLMGL